MLGPSLRMRKKLEYPPWGLAPFLFFGGPFEIFEGHILPSVKHNPIRYFLQKLNLSL